MREQSKKGYLTLALGKNFAEMAVDMALSIKQFDCKPISCVVDSKTKNYINKKYEFIFDRLIEIDTHKFCFSIKFHGALLSPYDETIFVDADIIILGKIDRLWENPINNHTIMIGDYLTIEKDKNHHGFSTSSLQKQFNVKKYLKTNSGCFYFNNESKAFFKSCLEKHKLLENHTNLNHIGYLGDEITIGITAERFNVGVFNIYPSLMMWDKELSVLQPDLKFYELPICHFIAPIPEKTVNWITAQSRNRRVQNSICSKGSKVWIELNRSNITNMQPLSIYEKVNFKIKKLLSKSLYIL